MPITYENFLAGGYTLFVFNLTPDLSNQPQPADLLANLKLSMKFSTSLVTSVTVLIVAIFDGIVGVNNARQVFTNYK